MKHLIYGIIEINMIDNLDLLIKNNIGIVKPVSKYDRKISIKKLNYYFIKKLNTS